MRAHLAGLLCPIMLIAPVLADAGPPPDAAGPGISHALALARAARYRDLHYTLDVQVLPPFDRMNGKLTIRVTADAPDADLVLDWRPAAGAAVHDLQVNGSALDDPIQRHDHLVIPRARLRAGENSVQLRFVSPIRASGAAVTRFRDPVDESEYVYTLLVPADASSVFPCFDQPDLKARFELSVTAPAHWRVIANGAEEHTNIDGASATTLFATTAPISTYLFAFAAGPFAELKDEHSATRLFVRASRLERARQEAGEVLRLTRLGSAFFARYFDRAFPFPKYDLVLLPEFAYAGMEHAGAAFLREDGILFPFQPAAADQLRRAELIFHETAHQWFGDLVTMRWFDDLWLKEGFASFMAAKAANEIVPELDPWNAFRASKTAAYRTDATLGTTPIRQDLPNLSGAKSAYGNIVYSKAPAVLKQAEFFLGEAVFRTAVRDFVARHDFGVADWGDLVGAFERASGRTLAGWADAWVKRRGLPVMRISWRAGESTGLSQVTLSQQDALREGGQWPMRVQLVLVDAAGNAERLPVLLEGESVALPALEGRPVPQFVFANDGDFGYGVFLLDDASGTAVLHGIGQVRGDLLRALLWDALWESVRSAQLPPLHFVQRVLRELPGESNELTAAGLLARLQIALRWYLADAQQAAIAADVESVLRAGMLSASDTGLRITWFRTYATLASTAPGRDDLVRLLAGQLTIPGVVLSSNDRFRIIRRLLTLGDPRGLPLLAEQARADRSDEGRRQAYAAAAAVPDASGKREAFTAFLSDPNLAERWIEESLMPFNAVEHETLTLPYLEPALRALPALKRGRKIFFVNNWLAAFVGGQRSPAALGTVERFLAQEELEPDLKLKLLEAMDGLERTVKIRARYVD
jgi:aminopeptidase N